MSEKETASPSGKVVLTDKGIAAVEQMDARYEELCKQRGVNPAIWKPELWIEANEKGEL